MTTKTPPTELRDSRVHFNIEGGQHDVFKLWAKSDAGGDAKIFDSIASMFVFAAALAYGRGARRSITGKKVDVFRWQNLDDLNQTVLRTIALAAAGGDPDVLADRGRIADVVEEYATAGVDILQAEIGDASRDRAVESLARLVCELDSLTQGAKS